MFLFLHVKRLRKVDSGCVGEVCTGNFLGLGVLGGGADIHVA